MADSFVNTVKQQVQAWLSQVRFSQTKPIEAHDDLVELPDIIYTQLARKIRILPSPNHYETTIQETIATTLEAWKQDLDAPNSLVFLGSPVEPIGKILTDSIQHWQNPPVQVVTPLPCVHRPRNPLIITQHIQQALQPYPQLDPSNAVDADASLTSDSLDERSLVIIIPCLEQCFLRCIGGWEGIEYLQDLAIHHRNCFWVIGCNHWAWNFLDFVCQVSAYFNEVKDLPTLDGTMVKDWLAPIANLVMAPDNPKPPKDQDDAPQPSERRQAYWDSLASLSSGVSRVVVNLWLQSLRVKPETIDADTPPQLALSETAAPEQRLNLHEAKPSLPSLPSLTHLDRYVLHSVLIHGQMTRTHLALSLGESESYIQSRVQWLLREGVLDHDNGALSVQPTYYAKLKTELANNNFLVGED